MDKNIITENTIKVILESILNEEASKVKREEYARVQFKIDELQASLSETIKELRKLQDSIPGGLKGVVSGRINGLSTNLVNSQKLIVQLKDKIKTHKRASFAQQVEEKKTK